MNSLLKAWGLYLKAFQTIRRNGLAHYFLYPFLLTLLVWTAGFYVASQVSDWLTGLAMGLVRPETLFPEWGTWLADVVYWALFVLARILLYLLLAFLSGSLVMVLMAPVFTFFSESLSEKLDIPSAPFSLRQFLLDILRAVGVATVNGALQIGFAIGCFFLGFIPVVGLAAPVLLFLINSYFYGFNFMDYTLERKQLSVRDSLAYASRKRFLAIGLGMPYSLWMMVPIAGPLFSGFAALFGVCAATVALEEKEMPERTRGYSGSF